MVGFEDFLMHLYHSKLKWMSIQSGYTPALWEDFRQNQINALSNLATGNFEIEAHIIASQSFFGNKIELPNILSNISICLKEQANDGNKNAFTMCVYNRLALQLH